ncbi:MAG: transposase [Verrucomicrobiae bacterium]|nr:transposase [Verrucomicrobiae bacterium]
METQFFALASTGAPLSEAIRAGAQLMLQKAVELEVTEFLGREHYQRQPEGPLRGYRNGYEPKTIQTAEGTLHLKLPQVRDSLEAFESLWLKSLVRRSEKLAGLIPQLYVKGLSSRDIEAALTQSLEIEGVSKSTVSALCRQLQHDFARWQERDLSKHQILYLFCDGIYLKLRPEDGRAIAVLVAYGIQADGKKVLLHLAVGDKESTVCWKGFFDDLKGRGLRACRTYFEERWQRFEHASGSRSP